MDDNLFLSVDYVTNIGHPWPLRISPRRTARIDLGVDNRNSDNTLGPGQPRPPCYQKAQS